MARVLVVDDDRSLLALAQATLQSAGHEVVVTSSASLAITLAETKGVDAVILDVVMPERSGFEILTELRVRPRTKHLAVLMLSARTEGPDRVRALRQGADDYLTKPLEPEELLHKLERALTLTAAASTKLGGVLEHFPLVEILQNLNQSARCGQLQIDSDGEGGEIHLWDGNLVSATWRGMQGAEAVFAMIRLGRGSFRFEPAAADQPAPANPALMVPLIDIIMGAAWLEDQLRRHQLLPPATRLCPGSLQGSLPSELDTFRSLPLSETMETIRQWPGVELGQLLRQQFAAPDRILLAATVLVEHGALAVYR